MEEFVEHIGLPIEAISGFLIIVVLGIVVFRLIKGEPTDKEDKKTDD